MGYKTGSVVGASDTWAPNREVVVGRERRGGCGRHFRVHHRSQQDNWEEHVCEGDGNRRMKDDGSVEAD